MDRQELEEKHGDVWDTTQLQEKFKVIAFVAPFADVEDRETGDRGSVEFQHDPRLYFNFVPRD